MGAQVVAFARREPREATVTDWTRDELAEFYRIEHALVQSGLSLDVERGITDEGDPWFVFCRADGEVLIHLTRYDGLYRLHSPALPSPLIGRSFAALTKSFSNQVPLHVTLKRDSGATLFVHPAAMLAVVIGTIFAASNEFLFSPQSHKHGDTSEAATPHNLKVLLQSTFQSYIENFFTWLRDGSAFQQSTYIAMITTVAAFLVGSDTATDDRGRDGLLASASHTTDTHAKTTHDDDTASAAAPAPANDSTHHTSEVKAAANAIPTQDASGQTQNHDAAPAEHTPSNVAAANNSTGQNAAAPQDDPTVGGNATDAANASNQLLASANPETPGQILTSVTTLALTGFGTAHIDLPAQSSSSPVAFSTVAVNDLLTALSALTQSGETGPNGQPGGLSNIATNNDLESLVSHAVQMNPVGGSQDLVSYFLTTNHIVSSDLTATASAGPALFNATAAATLVNFLEVNPNAQAVFNNKSVVIYDSLNDATPASVEVWKFADGSTIAIVGHADHGFVA